MFGRSIEHVPADGNLVAVHTRLLCSRTKLADGSLRQVHPLRFNGDKIVQYWDISPAVTPEIPNAAGAF